MEMELTINLYIEFKEKCVKQEIKDINEIIKLFGVWIKNN